MVGLIDAKGNWLLKPIQKKIEYAGEGLYRVLRQVGWGVIDSLGKEIIPCKYGYISNFEEGTAIVNNGQYSGLITSSNRFLLPYSSSKITPCDNGTIRMFQNNAWCYYYRHAGKQLSNSCYEKAYDFSEGLAKIVVEGNIGFVHTTGNMVIQPQFENAYDFKHGRCRARINKEWGFIDKTGQFIIQPIYEQVSDFFAEE